MKRKLLSLLLAGILLLSILVPCAPRVAAEPTTTRDTVLVLDDSGSMDGQPLAALMASAEKFCTSLLNTAGTNRIAVVTYSNGAAVNCEFTGDLTVLQTAIADMNAYGGTNIHTALEAANELLSGSEADVKNIVLMSDGLPNSGARTDSGKYSYADYAGYDYANAVYELAAAYHADYYIYTLGFFHNMDSDTLAFAARFMEDLQNAGYYQVTSAEELEFTFGEIAEEIIATKVTGTFRYPSDGKDYSDTYYYDDAYFYDDSFVYNQSLATMSLCMAMSAFGSCDMESYENKSYNVQNLLTELQFTDLDITDTFREKPGPDTIAAAIGRKKIRDNEGNVYTLLAVAIRGGEYEQEWASNFTIGLAGDHTGFSQAARQIRAFIESYIQEQSVEGDIKLWITGYSRAAATANLTAASLDKDPYLGQNVTLEPDDLYAYCFETPAGAAAEDARNTDVYGNIFNIINPNDLVTKVAPAAMGFMRYGVDKVLMTEASRYNAYSEEFRAMLERYNSMESTEEYVLNQFSMKKMDVLKIIPGGASPFVESGEKTSMGIFLDDVIGGLVRYILSRDIYYSTMEDGVRELCKAIFQDQSKAKDILSTFGDKFWDGLGDVVVTFLWQGEYQAYELVGSYLTDTLKEYGAENFDEEQIKKAAQPLLDIVLSYLLRNLDDTATILGNRDYFFPAHYPQLCLAWMQSADLNYTTDAGQAFSSGDYRIVRINCPVDVQVFDSQGKLVAQIVNDEVQMLEDSSIISLINSDGEKVLYLPPDEDFSVEMAATDDGSVTYSVNEYSYGAAQVSRLVNYYALEVADGDTMQAQVPAYSAEQLEQGATGGTDIAYTLTDSQGNTLAPDLNVTGDAAAMYYTVIVEAEEGGMALGSGQHLAGSFSQVIAEPQEGYTFEGWYVGEKMASADAQYRFCVTEDVTLTARFAQIPPETEPKQATTIPETVPEPTEQPIRGNTALLVGAGAAVVLLLVGVLITVLVVTTGGKRTQDDSEMQPVQKEILPHNTQETEDSLQDVGVIEVLSGSMRGFAVPIRDGETVCIGKDPKLCHLVLTREYTSVSRMHCTVTYHAAKKCYYVVDCSSYGTFITGQGRIPKGRRTVVMPKTALLLSNEKCGILLG